MPIDLVAAVIGWLVQVFGDAGISLVRGSRDERELRKAVEQTINVVVDRADAASREALRRGLEQCFSSPRQIRAAGPSSSVGERLRRALDAQVGQLEQWVNNDTGRPFYEEVSVGPDWVTGQLFDAFITALRQVVAGGGLAELVHGLDTSDIMARLDALGLQVRDLAVAAPVLPQPGGAVASQLVRSAYLEQVQRIAPPLLHGRSDELAELAKFCTDPGRGPYAWWQAPAWAGKSALMSWFVLHPPQGIQLVSFFITARYKSQDDAVAFTDAVMEQLADVLQQPMPAYLTETTREPHLLRMLAEATEACQQLVLLVDGLDEDRGVTTGPDTYSIAALLPIRPPPGLRIIVASRPDPPIPAEVSDSHPLRDPGVVRVLDASPSAAVVRADMQRELKRLLYGDNAHQDLLGLITAAGGGLSAADLAELTDIPVYDIEENLCTVAGRTFTTRTSPWQPRAVPPVYILGHEELQVAATIYLGPARLMGYRDQLHGWARTYREQSWPTDTPEYLLRGYFRMLEEPVDIARIIDCASDRGRHNRMLDITGGDIAALTEITDAQNLLLRQKEQDLMALSRLNAHRSIIAERNAHIPHVLPAVWATIGHAIRAEALAQAITEPHERAQALAELVRAVAGRGDMDRAQILAVSVTDPYWRAYALAGLAGVSDRDQCEALVHEAEAAAWSVTDPYFQARALAELAETVSGTLDSDQAEAQMQQAETAARSIASQHDRAHALADVTRAMAKAGSLDQAQLRARSITEPEWRAYALIHVLEAAATAGYPDQAAALIQEVGAAAREIFDDYIAGNVLADLVDVVAKTGDRSQAQMLVQSITEPDMQARARACVAATEGAVDRAVATARSITELELQAEVMADLVRVVAMTGDLDQAQMVAQSITDLDQRAQALTDLARATAETGDLDGASGLAQRAEATARLVIDPEQHVGMLGVLAGALAGVGDLDRASALTEQAETATRSIADPHKRAQVLIGLTAAVAGIGDLERAESLVQQTEEAIASITIPEWQARVQVSLTEILGGLGDLDRAEVLARSITIPEQRAQALVSLVQMEAELGNLDQARALTLMAKAAARSIYSPYERARALAALAGTTAEAGHLDQVRTLVQMARAAIRSITDPGQRARALAALASARARAGHLYKARTLVQEAEAAARSISHKYWRSNEMAGLVGIAGTVGDLDRAESLAESVTDPYWRASAMAELVKAMIRTGELDRAEALAQAITVPHEQAESLAGLVEAAAEMGDLDRAESLAESVISSYWQAHALASIAMNAELDHAQSLVARALVIGHWHLSVGVLVQIDSGSVIVIADEYLRGMP